MTIPKGMFDKVVGKKVSTSRTLGSVSGGFKRGQLVTLLSTEGLDPFTPKACVGHSRVLMASSDIEQK